MNLKSNNNFFTTNLLTQTLGLFASMVIVAAIGMMVNPASFHKFFELATEIPPSTSSLSYYWDVNAYAELALTPQCSAFYPLWPYLIRSIFHPQTIPQAAYLFAWSSRLIWLLSLPLTLIVFRQALNNNNIAFACALLYTLSPFSIFRAIGYTESIFALFSLALIYCYLNINHPQHSSVIKLTYGLSAIAITGLISLTRPALVQIIGSAVSTLITLWLVKYLRDRRPNTPDLTIVNQENPSHLQTFFEEHRWPIVVSICITLGAIGGYSIYGHFCAQTTGDFWGPFSQQKLWNKSLDFKPWLLLSSRSPLPDLLGLYFPVLLWLMAIGKVVEMGKIYPFPRLNWHRKNFVLLIYPPLWAIFQWWHNWQQSKQNKTAQNSNLNTLEQENRASLIFLESYTFWFSIYFACAHSAIVFLTQDRLVSLGRYIFGQPFIFLVLGYLLIDLKHYLNGKQRSFYFYGLISCSIMLLIDQWTRYGANKWLG